MLECIGLNNILAHMGVFRGVRNIFIQYSLLACVDSGDLTNQIVIPESGILDGWH